jgi:hypothetical protein
MTSKGNVEESVRDKIYGIVPLYLSETEETQETRPNSRARGRDL